MKPAILAEASHHANIQAQAESRPRRIESALAECKVAWFDAYDDAIEKGHDKTEAVRAAAVAYKLAMPRLESKSAIKAYIAAVAQGIQLEVFDGRDGSQLLYAAQVAMSLFNRQARKK